MLLVCWINRQIPETNEVPNHFPSGRLREKLDSRLVPGRLTYRVHGIVNLDWMKLKGPFISFRHTDNHDVEMTSREVGNNHFVITSVQELPFPRAAVEAPGITIGLVQECGLERITIDIGAG